MAAAAVVIQPPPPQPLRGNTRQYMPHQTQLDNCPTCGTPVGDAKAEEQRKRIADLEAQVKLLTDKATSAADKLADYEDELRRFRTRTPDQSQRPTTSSSLFPSRPSTEAADPPRPSTSHSSATTTNASPPKPSRFSFLSRSTPAVTTSAAPPLPATNLQAQLEKEQRLRQQAEGKLQSMNIEIEELSTQLFEQANNMVATERKARARLEERVAILERRDEEKRRRLERLEGAMRRIERVKGLLDNGAAKI